MGANLKVAKRYARALFELCDLSKLDEMEAALQSFSKLWLDDLKLRSAMLNPAFPLNERLSALRDLATNIKSGDKNFSNLLEILLQNKRLEVMPEISSAFSEMIDQIKKLLSLEVTSAFELPQDEKEKILKRVQTDCGSMASIVWKTDSEIIGGLKIKAGDKLLDGSVTGSLERFRNQLIG